MADEKMPEEEKRDPKGPRAYSRRRFLFGSGLAVGGAVAATVAGSTLAPTRVEAGGGDAAAVPAPTGQVILKEVPVTLQKAMGYVSYDPANCAGCYTCMTACTLYHEGVVNPELARIQVVAPVVDIFQVQGNSCKQCDGPECLAACPTKALHVDPQTGARVIEQNLCIGCQSCIKACPQAPNAPIRFNAATKKSLKCDLCGGDPLCVKFCPKSSSVYSTKVLTFVKKEA